jgi:formylglycine-generating enzyme required for sulfatase activity
VEGWPFDTKQAKRRQRALGIFEKEIDAGGGEKLTLVRIPAGEFVMGDATSQRRVVIEKAFWMSTLEITNGQFALFDPSHNSGYFTKRYQGKDGPGLSLDGAAQPVVRVSWDSAMAYCRWLSQRTGMTFTLPSEEQWEYACRAGTSSALSYGDTAADFSGYGNLADKSLAIAPGPTGGLGSNITAHKGNGIFLSALLGGNVACDVRFDDRAVITTAVGSYSPNAWGLCDMHGNAAEWTVSEYSAGSGREAGVRKVVRGGSFHDRPKRCTSAFGLGYPGWRRVFNVGFRVVCNLDDVKGAGAVVLAP